MSDRTPRDERNAQTCRDWLDATSARDAAKIMSCWTEDAAVEFPYAFGDFPVKLVGHAEISPFIDMFVTNVKEISFYDVAVEPLLNGDHVILKFKGRGEMMNGAKYNNTYIAHLLMRDGKIAHHTEYFNPMVVAEAFGMAAA
jgi:uncharacterized protein